MRSYAKTFYQRYSTALLADAAFRSEVPVQVAPAGILPIRDATKLAGPIRTVRANNDLVSILGVVHRAEPGDIVVITNPTKDVGVLGDVIATEAQRKGLAGFVVDGRVRDIPVLMDLDLPVFCRGRIPVGPLKLSADLKGIGEIDVAVMLGEATIEPGHWAFGDADGVIFLPANALEAVYERAEESMEREQVLLEAMKDGQALGDLLAIESFLRKRSHHPEADFNQHLALLDRAI